MSSLSLQLRRLAHRASTMRHELFGEDHTGQAISVEFWESRGDEQPVCTVDQVTVAANQSRPELLQAYGFGEGVEQAIRVQRIKLRTGQTLRGKLVKLSTNQGRWLRVADIGDHPNEPELVLGLGPVGS